jgi:crotonobetainyl-CoA:carnitine CoA-transferase CaiB-like acyl-CoA transferase
VSQLKVCHVLLVELEISAMEPAALGNVKVLDAATLLAGPITAAILGDYGAEVIKIEHPLGDPLRRVGAAKQGVPLFWKMINRNKRCITLDLSKQAGAALLRRLAADADVLIENFRPGTMERWGLGWNVLHGDNPRLIMLRVSGFGQDGPYFRRPAFGTVAEALSGFCSINGDPDGPPMLPPTGLGDTLCGMAGAWAVAFALYHRDLSGGTGQLIDLALYEPLLATLGMHPLAYDQLGTVATRAGNRSLTNAPRNAYRTADGQWVAISTSSDRTAADLLRCVGHPEVCSEPWFRSGAQRAARSAELDAMVGSWIAERELAQVMAELTKAAIPVTPFLDVPGVMADPHIQYRAGFVTLADPELGELRMQNVIGRLSATPGRVSFPGRPVGSDNDAVFQSQLGLPAAALEELRAAGVIS